MGGMGGTGAPEWLIREDAGQPVLLALYLRQVLGIRSPDELPHLRGIPPRANDRSEEAQALLERQWREYWAMTVEPTGAPVARAARARRRIRDARRTAVRGLRRAAGRDASRTPPRPWRSRSPRTSATGRMPRPSRASRTARTRARSPSTSGRSGRRAHSFELNVQVLPLTQRGVWWIGSLTIAVTDGLRGDVVAFDAAIHPIIAELA